MCVLDERVFLKKDSAEFEPNNDLLIVCEHASCSLQNHFMLQNPYENILIQGHDGQDPGASELSMFLAESTQCMTVMSNFSKLVIDPALPLTSENLIPLHYKTME